MSRRLADRLFGGLCLGAASLAAFLVLFLLGRLLLDGLPRLDLGFVLGPLSSRPGRTGVGPAVLGSLGVLVLAALVAVPLGVAAAVYLEEFQAGRTRLKSLVQLAVTNLAGVPGVVFGLLGLAAFVRGAGLGSSLLAAALTLALLALPTVVLVTQEALRAVPTGLREASLGLGASPWATICHQVLPSAAPGILTGVVLALSRVLGETAPLIVVGAVVGVVSAPTGPGDRFTTLPVQIYNWSRDAKPGFHAAAAAAIVVLVAGQLAMNGAALWLRSRARR